VSNFKLNLGPRIVWVGDEPIGECDGLTILIEEATPEEIEKLKEAEEIRLVKRKMSKEKKERGTKY